MKLITNMKNKLNRKFKEKSLKTRLIIIIIIINTKMKKPLYMCFVDLFYVYVYVNLELMRRSGKSDGVAVRGQPGDNMRNTEITE